MRFRTKTGLPTWLICVYVCVGLCVLILGIRSSSFLNASLGSFLILVALLHVLIQLFIYWQLNTVSLRQRKFWKKKEISWPDVNSISRFGTTDSVQIMYRHQAEDYSFIVASPKENSKFIAALRLFAPQAHFDL